MNYYCRECNSKIKKEVYKTLSKDNNYFKKKKTYYQKNKKKYRAYRLASKYGITQKDYDQMFRDCYGRCAICRTSIEGRSLDVDHCHKTEKVRGLLCSKCNRGLGFFQDSVANLKAAIKYLQSDNFSKSQLLFFNHRIMDKVLKYDFSAEDVNFILSIMNRVEITGVQTASRLVEVTQKLQRPLNHKDLELEQLEELKAKYETKKESQKEIPVGK